MSFAQCHSQKISQVLKVKNVNIQNLTDEQLQFSKNSNQIILKTDESLKESNSLIDN